MSVTPDTQPAWRSHCSWCGTRYLLPELRPEVLHRKCLTCHNTSWLNPTPIAVQLQVVHDDTPGSRAHGRLGVLTGTRGIQPKLGQPGLLGGFVEWSDQSYEAAGEREKTEEAEFEQVRGKRPFQANRFCTLLGSLPGDPGQVLAFSYSEYAIGLSTLETFVPCAETPAVAVAWVPEQLCFSSHTEALRRWHPNSYVRGRPVAPSPAPDQLALPYQVFINGGYAASATTEEEAWEVIGQGSFGSLRDVRKPDGTRWPEFDTL